MKIALAGNPNSGKTTLYNKLTGKKEHAGNWAGVTVDKKEAEAKKEYTFGNSITIVDLPGAYSMSPFTAEESITSMYVKNEKPDVIINIIDGTNLSRSLFFTTQLLELGIPVVVALNKSDLNIEKNIKIDLEKLSEKLFCPIVETISTSAKGLNKLIEKTIEIQDVKQKSPFQYEKINLNNKDEVERSDIKRFEFVNSIVKEIEKREIQTKEKTTQDKLDEFLVNKWLGIPIFALVMWGIFAISQTYLGPILADVLVGWIENLGDIVSKATADASPFLKSLLVDGIIGGFGAVVGFLPLVMVMYFLIALLEDCGYMARVAVVMNTFFKKVGLSGKSIIPMIIGTGCAIPGIMACRTIKNERERRTTAMLTPFMPCGAKLPVIALFSGIFFGDKSWLGTLMYFVGIGFIILGALLVLKITGTSTRKSFFIIELPEYKIPSIKFAFFSMLERGKAYIIKAGTIILVCNATVQIMQSFTWSFKIVEEGMESTSILASISTPFAILLIPLGFGTWQLAAAAITGIIAKENVVGTLAVVFGITNFIDTDALELIDGANQVARTINLTSVAAVAYLMFNLFTPPCFAAIGAMNSEMQDSKWLWGGIALQFGTGYSVAFLVYQIGTFVTTGSFGRGLVQGIIFIAVIIIVVLSLIKKGNNKIEQYSIK